MCPGSASVPPDTGNVGIFADADPCKETSYCPDTSVDGKEGRQLRGEGGQVYTVTSLTSRRQLEPGLSSAIL